MAVREGFLALLLAGENYGFRLHSEWAERTTRVVNVGQSYATLERLTKAGLIESAGVGIDGLEQYRVTATGRLEATAWLLGANSATADPWDETRDRCMLALSLPAGTLGELSVDAILRGEWDFWRDRATSGDAKTLNLPQQLAASAERRKAAAALDWIGELEQSWRSDPKALVLPFSTNRPKRGRPAKTQLAPVS